MRMTKILLHRHGSQGYLVDPLLQAGGPEFDRRVGRAARQSSRPWMGMGEDYKIIHYYKMRGQDSPSCHPTDGEKHRDLIISFVSPDSAMRPVLLAF